MVRKLILLAGMILLTVSPIVQGATRDFQQIGSKNNEMRKSLAWVTEGLYQLGKNKNSKLILTKMQKKKILPVFQALIGKKLVLLELDPNNAPGARQGQGQRQGVRNQEGQARTLNPDDPQVQQRTKRMQEQIDFGNAQMDMIDGFLTKEQVNFIDNVDFKAEKYGFLDFQRMSGNNGRGAGSNAGTGQGSTMGGGSGMNQQAFQKLRQKIRAGQEQLVKLNNEVLKLLKS